MIYLILCIFSSTLILIVFKMLDRLKVGTLNAIIVNYFTAALLGILTGGGPTLNTAGTEWFKISLITGFLFVSMFMVIGYSARVAGITLTSLTTKLSVVIPVLFSIVAFGEAVTPLKVSGMVLALIAIVMIVWRGQSDDRPAGSARLNLWLPLVLFLGAGFIDSLIKYSQEVYVTDNEAIAFATTTFLAAGTTSIGYRFILKRDQMENRWHRVATGGIALGIVNFGSLYFLIMALEKGSIASSVVFGITNIGVVMLSVIAGMLFFREKTTLLNKAGILLAIIAIFILFHS